MDSHIQASGWPTLPLADCVDILDRLRKPVNAKERQTRPGPVPYYGATGQVGWIDEPIFDEELVLLGEDGAPFLDKSKPIAYIIDGPSWVNNHAHVLRARAGVTTNRYIKHYLDSFDFTNYVQGSTRDKLNQGDMKTIPVLLPPPDIQDGLVSTVDAVFSKRASAAEHVAAARRAIERSKQAVLQAACSGRITADWRDTHRPSETSLELLAGVERARRERLGRRFKPSSTPAPGEDLPDTWSWTTVGALVDLATGATPLRKRSDYYGGSVPWVTSGAVNAGLITESSEYITELALRETNAKVFPAGTLLVAMYGEGQTRGRVAELAIDAATNQAVAALLFNDESEHLRAYLRLFFLENYERIRRLSFGGVQPNLSLGVIRDTPVPLPPLEEQYEIVRRVDLFSERAGSILARIGTARASVDRSAQAVLATAFRGELVGSS
jgi:type I restriction enzyme S subunit